MVKSLSLGQMQALTNASFDKCKSGQRLGGVIPPKALSGVTAARNQGCNFRLNGG